ncbi:alpha/beta fold hydrolase [Paracidovorax cattleyae]|uniref:alpha/beta fold hydrolase n=1 Tax=Paracidovorax cattleyae TaxID=80868 RepID=UPI000D170B36|nr:alpha/beta fold hydrolase [Paracidovorax cattleyae]AVS75185.1 hypothetical protein C8240_15405 [Paracidovorax cattleyae]
MSVLMHLSDLHFGAHDPRVCAAVQALARALPVSVVVVSGDLTQRATVPQFAAAHAFIAALPARHTLVMPGNHDLPLFAWWERIGGAYRRYARWWGDDREPVCDAGGFFVVGVDTTRPWRHSQASLSGAQIDRAARRLAGALRPRVQDGDAGPVVLLGYSVGGVLALLTALQPGLPVAGVVAGNTGAHSSRHGDPGFARRVREGWTAEARRDFLRTCFARTPPAMLFAQLCAYLDSLAPEALLQSIEGLRAVDLRPLLPSLRGPVLVLHGERDMRRSVADAEELAACLPSAQLRLLPGGHTPMVDCLPQYLQALHPFLAALAHQPAQA